MCSLEAVAARVGSEYVGVERDLEKHSGRSSSLSRSSVSFPYLSLSLRLHGNLSSAYLAYADGLKTARAHLIFPRTQNSIVLFNDKGRTRWRKCPLDFRYRYARVLQKNTKQKHSAHVSCTCGKIESADVDNEDDARNRVFMSLRATTTPPPPLPAAQTKHAKERRRTSKVLAVAASIILLLPPICICK